MIEMIERMVCNVLLECFKNLCESFLRTQEIYDMINEDVHVSIRARAYSSLCAFPCAWVFRDEHRHKSLPLLL